MDIRHVFEDPRIVMLEEDIARINEYYRYSDEEKYLMEYLLEERSSVLRRLNVYDDEMKQLLIEFNDALRKACTKLHRQTMAVYQECLHNNNLYDHCYFSLYDLIYVREFNLEVHVEFDDNVKY